MIMKSNICFILNSLLVGGSEKKIVTIANYFQSLGYPCHVLYLQQPSTLIDQFNDKIKCVFLNRQSKLDLKVIKAIFNYFAENNIHYCFSIDTYPAFLCSLSFLLKKPFFQHFVLINTSLLSSRYNRFIFYIQRPFLNHKTIIYGSHVQQRLWEKVYRLRSNDSFVIYNGVNTDYFNPEVHTHNLRQELHFDEDDIVIGTVAVLRPEKALHHLYDALIFLRLKYNNKVKLLIAGSGQQREFLLSRAKDLNISDSVVLLGHQHDVRPVLNTLDIFILPSIAVETFSNACLEAMAMKKPVILSDIGGAREMVSVGKNGYVFTPGDVSSLAAYVDDIILNNNIKTFGEHSRSFVNKHFSLPKMLDSYATLIQ